MHNSYFLIKQLVPVLKQKIEGLKLIESFSQNKDELILKFNSEGQEQEFIIIAHLTSSFSCLAFPDEFNKARKNTILIFKTAFDKRVINVRSFLNERAFAIELADNMALVFKLYGNQANLILFQDKKPVSIFKHNYKSDKELSYSSFDRNLDQSDQAILNNINNPGKVFPTLGKPLVKELINNTENKDEQVALRITRDFINQLENPNGYSIIKSPSTYKLSLIPDNNAVEEFSSPDMALTHFFRLYLKSKSFLKAKDVLLKNRYQSLIKTQSYLSKTRTKLNTITEDSGYREKADLIMANLHNIQPNTSSIELDDFFTGSKREIKLNPKLNAQQNAEKYYKKAKNVGIEQIRLKETIAQKESFVSVLEDEIKTIEEATEFLHLKEYIKKEKSEKKTKEIPFKVFIIDDFTIWVGKNARQNDLLTLKYAAKEDLFFHAKDVSGSHVILKQQAGKSIPKYTVEKVAALAAYYSKKKTDSLCPVGYTPKKYVRKPKGSPPGLVIVEKEKVLLVKPEIPS
ncbi:MAG: NFACT RNA binding domain-containing protein [Bacteroidota bacterium]